MLNIPVKVDIQTKRLSQIEYYQNIVSSMVDGLACPERSRRSEGDTKEWLFLSKDELKRGKEILHNINIPPDSLIIGINPGAAYGSAKRWHPERFALLCRTLVNTHNANVIVFGSQQELNIAAEIVNLSQVPVISMAGKTSIRELMSLIKQCSIFVTNDSGPMHIAAALNIPITAIFGSTDPEKTGPMGNNHIVIKKDVDCSPCFKRKCPTDLKCMDLITVDDVLKGVERIIEKQ